jgi:pyruvate kinase
VRPRHHRLELVATVGPASEGLIPELLAAGATQLRLNASHVRGRALDRALDRVLAAAPPGRVVVDLQGAKMRVELARPRRVRAGHDVTFALAASRREVPLPHPELFEQAAVGDVLTADDGRLRFRVTSTGEGRLAARALGDGVLRPRKGVNLASHPVALAALVPFDREAVQSCRERRVSTLALSFLAGPADLELLRRAAPGVRPVAKIERAEAVMSLAAISRRADAVWICRGDLQEQVGPLALGRLVSGLEPRRLRTPVLMAGQVLQGLVDAGAPSRSEVCHLCDLVARGYAGIVLSDETAMGRDPVGAVRVARELLDAFARA